MRQRAEWMTPSDDVILELIHDLGNLTPAAIAEKGDISRQHASVRCAELVEYGLLERVHRGLYGITDAGEEYLAEELDAATLEPGDDV